MNALERRIIGYSRFSSDMQREESCEDQERNIREWCAKNGIDTSRIEYIRDLAESGTKVDRPGFSQLQGMILRGEVEMLVVDDASRLTRKNDLANLIEDIVFHGGRFIAIQDGIDTEKPEWEMSAQMKGMMNSHTIRQLSRLVRRGQRGRVEDDGSAGDFPFGYESHLIDPNAPAWTGRGPKPKKGIRVNDAEAEWVQFVFRRYGEDLASIAQITRELNQQKVPKGHRSSKPGWHHEIVRRMLANKKYVGIWKWGESTTLRDSRGKKKQIPVKAGEAVIRNRPALRIIDDDLWQKVQTRLREQRKNYAGLNTPHPKRQYPKRLLSGMLKCGQCGAPMILGCGARTKSYACSNHAQGRGCPALNRVPAEKAENSILAFVSAHLCSNSEWLDRVCDITTHEVGEQRQNWPAEQKSIEQQLGQVNKRLANLLDVAEKAVDSTAIAERIKVTEQTKSELEFRLRVLKQQSLNDEDPPETAWICEELANLSSLVVSGSERIAQLIRQLIGPIVVHAIVSPGKKRGRMRLEFRPRLSALVDALLPVGAVGVDLRETVERRLADEQSSPQPVAIEVGEPTRPELVASEIVAMREAGMPWKQIGKKLGMRFSNVWQVWKRHVEAGAAHANVAA